MRKTLATLITGTTMLGLTACSTTPPSYPLPTFQQISSTAQSCSEIDETLTFHNVKIDEFMHTTLEERLKWPIVISGKVPTTDYNLRRMADVYEAGEYDKNIRQMAQDVIIISEKHFGAQYTNEEREKKLNGLINVLQESIAEAIRTEGIVLYVPNDLYAQSVVQYVKQGRLKGKFTVHGNLACLSSDEFREANRRVDAVAENFGYEKLPERVAFNDLLYDTIGTLINGGTSEISPKPNLILYLRVTGIEKTRN